ncbi:MAG: phosphomannomutase/phosphoglucomutase [Acidimicrobiia bacterium]|nr:phosphomannomutase/phosphoglucomutase [Acidimicrobiia bacterium]
MDLDAIFKAYDVRGLVPSQLDEEAARRIGSGFARFAGVDRIAIGHDCRVSSPALTDALIEGVTGRGVGVIALGQITTDMLYQVAGALDVPGVVVTASHNPAQYNGLKFCLGGAVPVGVDSGLAEVKSFAADPEPEWTGPTGIVTGHDPVPGYLEHVFDIVQPDAISPLRVAVDGGNGMAGLVVPAVAEIAGIDLTGLYLEPDGTFPNHPADPLDPANLVDLVAVMERGNHDLGIAFDGDADRAFFVDDTGSPLSGSTVTALVAEWYLRREPGAAIVHNLICSRAVAETVLAAGGRPVRTRVGHSYIKQTMAETGAVFGGEHSGHYYFRDHYRADSGILAALVLMQILSEGGVRLTELRSRYEPYAASGEINLSVGDKKAVLDTAAGAFPEAAVDRLDGVTVEWPDRWFNMRPSNTEPFVRLNVEASDGDAVEELVREVRAIVESEEMTRQ